MAMTKRVVSIFAHKARQCVESQNPPATGNQSGNSAAAESSGEVTVTANPTGGIAVMKFLLSKLAVHLLLALEILTRRVRQGKEQEKDKEEEEGEEGEGGGGET